MKLIYAAVAIVLAATLFASMVHAQETGVPSEISSTVDVLFSGDSAAIEHLLVATEVPCQGEPALDYTFPVCPEGVEEETLVETFPSSACEGAYQTAEAFPALVERLSTPGPELVGIYRAGPERTGLMSGDYVAVYTGIEGQAIPGGVWLTAEGITGLQSGCAVPEGPISTLEGFVDRFGLQGPIDAAPGLPPTGVARQTRTTMWWPAVTTAVALLGVTLVAVGGTVFVSRRKATE